MSKDDLEEIKTEGFKGYYFEDALAELEEEDVVPFLKWMTSRKVTKHKGRPAVEKRDFDNFVKIREKLQF